MQADSCEVSNLARKTQACFLLKLKQPASVMFLKFHPSCYQFLRTRETLYSLVMSHRQEIHSQSFASDKWIIARVKIIHSIMLEGVQKLGQGDFQSILQ